MRIGSPLGLPLRVTALAIGAPELGISCTEESVQSGLRRMRPGPVLAGVAYLRAGSEGRGDADEHWAFVHRLHAGTPLAHRLPQLER